MQKRILLFAILLCAFGLRGFAQNSVRGNVKDMTGEPLMGVVITYGSDKGTVTDIEGNFSVNVPDNTILKFSYIGYKPQFLKAVSSMNITLEEDHTTLEDVVVVGYGTMKRRDLTGAVASVSGDKLAVNPVANVAQALQGQLPGVNVITQDGRPGAKMSIRVRGGGSITQSNEPLYIVDGIAVSDISDIPVDNIESIDVLKDAASTAIYGARGANGVILVTTKNSDGNGKVSVKYNMYFQVKKTQKPVESLNAYDYVLNQWSYASSYSESYGDGVAQFFGLGTNYGNHLNDYKNVAVHDYVDDVMRTANSWNHDLSLSGGNQNTKYYATVNYLTDEGNRIHTGFRRWSANFKISQKINKELTFDANLRYAETKLEGTSFGYATGHNVYGYAPIDNPLGDGVKGNLGAGSASYEESNNPNLYIDNYVSESKRYRVRGIGALTWTPLAGLTAKTELSLSRNWSEKKDWDSGRVDDKFSKATLTKGEGYGTRWATTLNYQVQGLGKDHELSFLAGNEIMASKSSSSSMVGAGYPANFTMDQAFGLMTMYNMDSENYDKALAKLNMDNTVSNPNHTVSWFGRVNYNYMYRYLLTATFRADGSSKFAPNNHWGYFPAAAAAWRISDEPFMEKTKDWLDNLKLRLSYGTSGNDDIDASLWKEFWEPSITFVDGKRIVTFFPGELLANPDLKWETTISRNLGLDFSFWNGKLRGNIDLYWNTTKDILMKVPVAETTGHTHQFQNVGKTSNKGFELSLCYDIIRSKDFNLSVNATYNYNTSKVEKIVDGVNADVSLTDWGSTTKKPTYDYILREGQPVGTIQGFKSAGFYTVDDFNVVDGVWTLKPGVPDTKDIVNYSSVAMNSYARPEGQNAIPGMVKFKDVNGDGVINNADVTDLGSAIAKHTGGFNINGNYKGIDFSAGFTYQIGGKVYNANAMHTMMGNKDTSFGWNRLHYISDSWKMYDVDANGNIYAVTDPAALANLNAAAKYALPYNEYGLINSEFIEDASYLRLNALTIGYTIPKVLTRKIGIGNLRVYFTAGNLFCISGYRGMDPDVNTRPSGKDGYQTPNYDWDSYPRARTYTFGLNVTF